jgi:outer membrane protein OmpA-like peptidoglycan-associated protein
VRAALLSILIAPSSAYAGDALSIDLVPKAQKGQGQPELVVKAHEELKKVTIELVRSSDRRPLRASAGPIDPGKEHRFALTLSEVGAASYNGKLDVEIANGQSGSMPLNLAVELLPELELKVAPEDVDLQSRVVKMTCNRDLAKVQVSLMSDVGTPMGTTEAAPSDAGGKYAVKYDQSKGTVMRISIKGWDADGFFGGVDLFPWRVDIPHEEVNFASGKSQVEEKEAAKLESSFEKIQGAIQKYGKLATIKLFIAGHTDTVSDAAYNRTLSDDRARAIGRWFKKRGVGIPIRYAGFGEDSLLVQTADNVDEPRNRRAEYIVAVDPPAIKGGAAFRALD